MRRVPAPSSTPLFRRVSVRQGWSQLSREPRDTAQSWEDSSSHMLPSAQNLLGTSLLWVSLFPWSVGFSIVLFLHTQYYLLSIFQKLLKSTVYWHKPTVSYLGVSVTEVLYFTHFLFLAGDDTWWSEAMFWTGSCEFTSHLSGLNAKATA